MWVLYWYSDVLFFWIYHVIGYRKRVVEINLKNAFPNLTDQERKRISKKFYHWFCDFLMETIKSRTISEKRLRKLIDFENPEMFKEYQDKGQSIIIVLGHFGNWELGGSRFSVEQVFPLYVLYHPLSNSFFDRLVYKMRTRLGTKLYPMNSALKGMLKNKDIATATAFIADQTPSRKNAYWTQFLNQDTPVFQGTAKIAKKLNYPIVYVKINPIKRGKYRIESEVLIENPQAYSVEEITEIHTKRLEKDIIATPHAWLWTHRRWKHKR